jgi:recombinational DNA repair protein (RecF pathway)
MTDQAKAEKNAKSCTGCGSTVALAFHPDRHELLCAKCACERAMWDVSKEHITDLLIEPVQIWFQHWRNAGIQQDDLISVLEMSLSNMIEQHFGD